MIILITHVSRVFYGNKMLIKFGDISVVPIKKQSGLLRYDRINICHVESGNRRMRYLKKTQTYGNI